MTDKLGLILVGLSAVGLLVGISSCWNIKIDVTNVPGVSVAGILVGLGAVGILVGADSYIHR